MSTPIDLTNLCDMTGGDTALEQELFACFIESAEDCLQKLRENLAGSADANWERTCHALKGISYNLGAKALGDLCRDGQTQADSAADKQAMLVNMTAEYERVKAFLAQQAPT